MSLRFLSIIGLVFLLGCGSDPLLGVSKPKPKTDSGVVVENGDVGIGTLADSGFDNNSDSGTVLVDAGITEDAGHQDASGHFDAGNQGECFSCCRRTCQSVYRNCTTTCDNGECRRECRREKETCKRDCHQLRGDEEEVSDEDSDD